MSKRERRLATLVCVVKALGQQAGGALLSLPDKLCTELHMLAVAADDSPNLDQVLERLRPGFWSSLVTIHGWAYRDLAVLQRASGSTSRGRKATLLASALPSLFEFTKALECPQGLGKLVLQAVLRSDILSCYALLFLGVKEAPALDLQITASLVAVTLKGFDLFTTSASSSCGVAVDVEDGGVTSEAYQELLEALHRSSVLEHAVGAIMRLHESAAAALGHSHIDVPRLRSDLDAVRRRLVSIVSHIMRPYSCLPFGALCPRPICAPFGDVDSVVVTTLPAVRAVLSGTCLQYWLAWELIQARLAVTGGQGTLYGLPPAALPERQLLVPSESAMTELLKLTALCSFSWQFTVSGPLPPVPKLGLMPLLGGIPAVVTLPASLPYTATGVYELMQEVLDCLIERLALLLRVAPDVSSSLATFSDILIRLLLELRPRQAAPRFPRIWRVMSGLLGGLDLPLFPFDDMCGFLLSIQWLLRGPCPPLQPPPQQTQQHGDQRVEGAATAAGSTDSTSSTPHLPFEQEELQSGQRAVGDTAAAGAGDTMGTAPQQMRGGNSGNDCTLSLRCALDSGFLPSLEHQLRRCGSSMTGLIASLVLPRHALYVSGAWPALMAHGSLRDVASLIITLSKVYPTFGAETFCERSQRRVVVAPHSFEGLRVRLVDQSLAVLGTPPAAPANAAATANAGSSSNDTSGSEPACQGSQHAPKQARETARDIRLFGDAGALEEITVCDKGPSLDTLAALGGRPTRGSPEARQQRLMTVLALVKWLPPAVQAYANMERPFYAKNVLLRCLLAVTLQCLKARLQQRQAAQSGAAAFSGGDSGSPSGPTTATRTYKDESDAEVFLSWRRLLLESMPLIRFLGSVLESAAGASPVTLDGVAAALDVLEVLTLAVPEDVGEQVGVAAGAEQGSGAQPRLPLWGKPPTDGVVLDKQLLRRYGRGTLRTALEALSRQAQGAAGTSSTGGAAAALEALRLEVCSKHGLEDLPDLPSPEEAVRAAAEAGVRMCGNPECANLDGPQEAALSKAGRCSRCKAVHYCGVDCQKMHWGAGHKAECGRG